MAIRIKRQLRGKDGGKHPHLKTMQQEYAEAVPMPQPQLAWYNASIARNILRGHVGQLDAASNTGLLIVLQELENLLRLLERERP